MSNPHYTFWLMPADPLRAQLRKTVKGLAREFEAPVFDPHVTVYAGDSGADEVLAVAKKIAERQSRLTLEMAQLEQSAQFTKTFFVQFCESAVANEICEMMRQSMAAPSDYILNPHLSLLYKNMPEEKRRELCRRDIVPKGDYEFDAIQAVEFNHPWTGEYRVLGEFPLRG